MRSARYRSRGEIISSILEAANGGLIKTKIMHRTFLTSAQLKEYLEPLVESNMLEFDFDTHTYKTTPRGFRFIELNNRLQAMTNGEEQRQQLQLHV